MKHCLACLLALGLGSGLCACGDDGRAKMYETCDPATRCGADLVCIDLRCTRACSVSSTYTVNVGDCRASDQCADIAVGCCKITSIADNAIKGYCTVHP